jgi:hypothetical protein
MCSRLAAIVQVNSQKKYDHLPSQGLSKPRPQPGCSDGVLLRGAPSPLRGPRPPRPQTHRIYNRARMLDQMREAQEAWGDFILKTIGEKDVP